MSILQPFIDGIILFLEGSKPALLFTIIGVGYLVGRIKIASFSLGVSAVLFVGIAIGVAAPGRLILPTEIGDVGLILFVYMVGLQSGPGFFSSFAKRGVAINLIALAALLSAAFVAVLLSYLFNLSGPMTAGLFSGGMTNTPALAAAMEAIQASVRDGKLTPDQITVPVIGYSIAYPFSVIGSIIALHAGAKFFKSNYEKEIEQINKEENVEALSLHVGNFKITNSQIIKKKIPASVLQKQCGAVLSRYQRKGKVEAVQEDTTFIKGDIVVAVGTTAQLEAASLLIGDTSSLHIEKSRERMDYRRVIVSNPEATRKPIDALPLKTMFGATVTRVRRGDVEFVAYPETTLELGDRVRVVAYVDKMDEISKFLGDDMRKVSEAEILSPAFGMVLGVLLGMIPIPLPGTSIKLGFAAGPLIVALILGKLGKTGFIHWNIPQPVNHSLRQLGLLLFLATVGLKAGASFFGQMQDHTLDLIFTGAMITLVPILVVFLLGKLRYNMGMIRMSGIVAGIHTQPATLAAAQSMTGSDVPSISYATVYPFMMIGKIIMIQILVRLL